MSDESSREIPQDRFVTIEHVEVAAYYKWRNRGCPSNDSLTDWVDAHEEFKQGAVPKTPGGFTGIF